MDRKRDLQIFFICLPPQADIPVQINEEISESFQANG